MLTPGLRLCLRVLPVLLAPPLGLYGAFAALEARIRITIPRSLKCIGIAAAFPLLLISRGALHARRKRREAKRLGAVFIPEVKGTWIGNFDVTMRMMHAFNTQYIAQPFWSIVDELGHTFKFRVLWTDAIFTTEPEHVKQILATEFPKFVKGKHFIEQCFDVLGVGVFNADGDMWKFHRAMTRPFFSRERITHVDLFARHADSVIAQLQHRTREGYALDIQDALSRFTLDTASEFLFGRCVHVGRAGLPYPHNAPPALVRKDREQRARDVGERFAHAFSEAQSVISERTRLGLIWPFWEMRRNRCAEPMEVVRAFIEPILEDAVRKKKDKKDLNLNTGGVDEIGENDTLLDHLVNLTDDPTILRDETLNILIAGRDTTAATLTFAVYCLAMYPEVTKRLRTEIIEKVGLVNKPTYDDIREMKYLRAVINETLRLFPPVPFDVRESVEATTLTSTTPGGKPWYIPARTAVTYCVFMMHRRTDLWGPDALEFDPDRFLDARLHTYLTPNPFIFCPFNAGPRICLGQQFAYNEVSVMLIRLLQAFDSFTLDEEAQPPESRPPKEWKLLEGNRREKVERFFPKTHLTMYSYKGLWLRPHEASNEETA